MPAAGALPAAGLTPAYPGRLHLGFSLLLGRVMAPLRGALAGHACSAADLRDAAVEELRIVAPGSWSRAGSAISPCGSAGWGTEWEAGPLRLMLGFPSLSPTFHVPTVACAPHEDARVPHVSLLPLTGGTSCHRQPEILHRSCRAPEEEQRWVVLSRCSSSNWHPPALLYPEVTAVTPWAGYSLLRCPGQLCQDLYTQVGPLGCSVASQEGLGL